MSFIPLQSRHLAGSLIAVLAWSAAAASALAQATPAVASAAPGAWTSAFEGDVPAAPAQPVPWREANEQVGRIGGWRAYAREAQTINAQDGAAGAGPAPALPATSPASAPAAHRH